jgi:XTP/dITP diphosphohydrolase
LPGEDVILRSGNPTVWLVTGNKHKVKEANAILGKYSIPVQQLNVAKLEIQSSGLEEVARYASNQMPGSSQQRLVAVEDSGLFVSSLNGFPGAYSSFVHKTLGVEGILTLLSDQRDRRAQFQSVVALSGPGFRTMLFKGTVLGRIAMRAKGSAGFGFDPIFIPKGTSLTFAEGGQNAKNRYSHRSRAFRKLAAWYLKRWPNGQL